MSHRKVAARRHDLDGHRPRTFGAEQIERRQHRAEEQRAEAGDREGAQARGHAEAHQDEEDRDVPRVLYRRAEADDARGTSDAERPREVVADDDHHQRARHAQQHLRLIHRRVRGLVAAILAVHDGDEHADERGRDQLGQLEQRVSEIGARLRPERRCWRRGRGRREPERGPDHPAPHQPDADDDHADDGEHAVPPHVLGLRVGQRLLDLEHAVEHRDREDVPHAGIGTDQRESTMQALGRGVPAHERAEAGAVGERDRPQIHDHVAVALAKQLLDAPLEFLGRPAGDECLLRRQDQP